MLKLAFFGTPDFAATCLRRLWQTTQDGIRAQLDRLVEQTWDCLLETEQMSIGWNSSKGVRGP